MSSFLKKSEALVKLLIVKQSIPCLKTTFFANDVCSKTLKILMEEGVGPKVKILSILTTFSQLSVNYIFFIFVVIHVHLGCNLSSCNRLYILRMFYGGGFWKRSVPDVSVLIAHALSLRGLTVGLIEFPTVSVHT